MARKITPVVIVALVALTVFIARRGMQTPVQRKEAVENKQIVEIARNAVAANGDDLKGAMFDLTPQPGGGWLVGVQWRPSPPGHNRIIVIDAAGRVTDYIRGL